MCYVDKMRGLAAVLCISLILGACAAAPTSEFIEVQAWVDAERFALHFLWPLPGEFRLLEPPRHVQGSDHDYVWAWYSAGEPVNGIEPPIYMIYESSELPNLGEHFLSDYMVEESRRRAVHMEIQGQERVVEVRVNPAFEESGVALFEIEGTSIAFHWRHIEEAEALRALERHLVSLKDHPALATTIEEHIQQLANNQRR